MAFNSGKTLSEQRVNDTIVTTGHSSFLRDFRSSMVFPHHGQALHALPYFGHKRVMPKIAILLGLLFAILGNAGAQTSPANAVAAGYATGPLVAILETRFLLFRERPHLVVCPTVATVRAGLETEDGRLVAAVASLHPESNCTTRETLLKYWHGSELAVSVEEARLSGDSAKVRLAVSKGPISWEEVFTLRRAPRWGVIGYSITGITTP